MKKIFLVPTLFLSMPLLAGEPTVKLFSKYGASVASGEINSVRGGKDRDLEVASKPAKGTIVQCDIDADVARQAGYDLGTLHLLLTAGKTSLSCWGGFSLVSNERVGIDASKIELDSIEKTNPRTTVDFEKIPTNHGRFESTP